MKTARKVLLLVLCAALLVSASVMGTLAYLTDSEAVKNTFTVGNVAITLDEAPVDANGKKIDGARVKENKYHLLPGGSYDKDPIVTVDATSDDAWVFIKVENNISGIEAANNNVAAQILDNGWTKLDEGVYYKKVLKTDTDKTLEVFQTVTIAESVNNATLADYANKTVVVTAYAIQVAGFENNVAGAWSAVYAQYNTPAQG